MLDRLRESLARFLLGTCCPKHPGQREERVIGCPECWRERCRAADQEERARRVSEMADAVEEGITRASEAGVRWNRGGPY